MEKSSELPSKTSKSSLLNTKDLIAYFLVGGTGAAVQILAGGFFREYMGYNASVTLAYIVSFIVGFTLTKLFAFDAKKSGQTRREMIKFLMVAAMSMAITVGASSLALQVFDSFFPGIRLYELPFSFLPQKARIINIKEFGGLLVGMGLSFIFNYVMHKKFTFKSTGFYDRIKQHLRGIPE
ncbi:MAG: GtrA family protein [Siphonobacter sp.]